MRLSAINAICLSLLFALSAYGEKTEPPAVEQLADIAPQASIFAAVKGKEPLVINSAGEAAQQFNKEALAALSKQVDFNKQLVLVFAWQGSGQDVLEYKVLESFPEQVIFELTPGSTEDLCSHTRVYVLRSNVRWKRAG